MEFINSQGYRAGFELRGAELRSFERPDGSQIMHDGNPKYWKRVSPVLFPIIGTVNGNTFRVDGKEYHQTQHGFARDMEFTIIDRGEDFIDFELKSDENTKEKYPFDFSLVISYKLTGPSLEIKWKVKNDSDRTMYYSIGGHPAFLCQGQTLKGYKIELEKAGKKLSKLNIHDFSDETQLVLDSFHEISLAGGRLELDEHTFDQGALIIEDYQADKATIIGPDENEILSLKFSTPVFGIWSPVGLNAPFVCIEPWYGRADRTAYVGELKDRDFEESLDALQDREYKYQIVLA